MKPLVLVQIIALSKLPKAEILRNMFFFSQAPINFSNSEFYGFSEFYYCMEDVLRIGGQYNSDKYSQAAMVPRHPPSYEKLCRNPIKYLYYFQNFCLLL